jgi:hypothetical protein
MFEVVRIGFPWFGIAYGLLLGGIITVESITVRIDKLDVVV